MSFQARRILCVDDQEDLLVMLSYFLSAAGFHVITCADAEDALCLARAENFDAAVVDYAMPEMNGEELAWRLRDIRPKLPIVLFSASVRELPPSIFAVIDAAVDKGVGLSQLVSTLQRLTAERPVRRRAPRFQINLSARLHRPEGGDARARTADLGTGGVGLYGRLDYPPGAVVAVELTTPSGQVLLETTAEVRYTGDARTGLAWTHLTDRMKGDIIAEMARAIQP